MPRGSDVRQLGGAGPDARKSKVTPARNRGWFRTGFDPRRHQLTREERSRGGLTTSCAYIALHPADQRFPLTGKGAAREVIGELFHGES